MSSNPFGGKKLEGVVISELQARQKTNATSEWFASRSVWVKIMSRSQACTDPKLATMTGLNRFMPYEGGYDPMTKGGRRPYPIITGIKVASTGNLGTIREATINMIAFTKPQLNQLESCYLIPDMSVFIMFGWTTTAGGGSVTQLAEINGKTDVECLCAIKKAWPIADGVQGRVGKYDVSFNKDGMWWDITLKVIGASNAIMASPVESFHSGCKCETVSVPESEGGENAGESKKKTVSPFKGVFTKLCEYASKGVTTGADVRNMGNIIGVPGSTHLVKLNGEGRWKRSMLESIGNYVFGATCYEAYISIDGLIAAWQKYSVTPCNGQPSIGKFNNENGGALSKPSTSGFILASSDPHKVLFPPENYEGLTAASCVEGDYVSVGKILINAQFAYKCLEDCGKGAKFDDFMSKILQGVNDASGGLWELTVIDNGECPTGTTTPEFSIIDLQSSKKETIAFNLPINPESAVVRELSLALKMSDAMMTQAVYGEVRDTTTDRPCDDNRFKLLLKDFKNTANPDGCTKPDKEDCSAHAKLGCEEEDSKDGSKFAEKLKEMQEDLDDPDLKESCYTEQVRMNNAKSSNGVPSQCKDLILPYEFTFTVDGIGGFEFGQMVTTDALPDITRKYYDYQVVSVDHEVTHGDWKTTVRTVPRYK